MDKREKKYNLLNAAIFWVKAKDISFAEVIRNLDSTLSANEIGEPKIVKRRLEMVLDAIGGLR
jgi:hypothetical protein